MRIKFQREECKEDNLHPHAPSHKRIHQLYQLKTRFQLASRGKKVLVTCFQSYKNDTWQDYGPYVFSIL